MNQLPHECRSRPDGLRGGVLLFCDEGSGMGLGHRARCEAIAGALRARHVDAAVLPITDGIVAAPVIVVDSYRLRADDRHHFVPDVVVAIDDLERDMAVDCIVAPSPGARADAYSKARRVLAGAPYALVTSAPALTSTEGAASMPTRRPVVLVSAGAADGDGVGARIAAAIGAARPDASVQLVVGPWGCADVPDGVEPILGATTLAPVLERADVVVTAGGVTLLEALHLGRACITFAVADNQRANVDAVGDARAAVVTDAHGAAAAACALLEDGARRTELGAAGAALIDGRGAARVADTIIAMAARTTPQRVTVETA